EGGPATAWQNGDGAGWAWKGVKEKSPTGWRELAGWGAGGMRKRRIMRGKTCRGGVDGQEGKGLKYLKNVSNRACIIA
ncbi:MAG: hypothetical protein J6Y19_05875, partial [Kiritimatiellae bacterium]|nr:hypothetical protein [Kiritimatiellia bacterium]